MASFYKTAATVCLVALSALESEAQQSTKYKFTVVDVDEDAYLSTNLARNGKLPVHISEVTKDESLVTDLTAKVAPEAQQAAENCAALITTELKNNFHHSFEYEPASKASPDYRQILQDALDVGLKEFKCTEVVTPEEPEVPVSLQDGTGASETPEGTSTKDAVLFCQLKPAAVKNSAPFDEEYFNGLIERTTELKDMTEDDLKNSVGNGPAATASTIIIAGLVAILTAVSA
ncbi:uncharacterized protein EMH_0098790 [Eimeria mitis]|uniref:SAG family member n=1 Tax=Eimeria mitis TaxID=44415 RepID=U6JX95_9EIME|nr:uncharacterized protein EMH_0098790 [Eimeria mitis]CDJ28148.1 hypothetical protein, conserved [Eimeria mitis]